jgi:hypothetical protein
LWLIYVVVLGVPGQTMLNFAERTGCGAVMVTQHSWPAIASTGGALQGSMIFR